MERDKLKIELEQMRMDMQRADKKFKSGNVQATMNMLKEGLAKKVSASGYSSVPR